MRKVIRTSRFVRDLKRAVKKRKNIQTLAAVVEILQRDGWLPVKYKPHRLVGNWSPKYECHLEPDWLLIYEVSQSEVALIRLGTHDELF